jgi:hypothetical protein
VGRTSCLNFLFNVSGTRSTRALSVVHPASNFSPASSAAFFNASASGNHSSGVRARLTVQYKCAPPPDRTIVLGGGKPTFLMKALMAAPASFRLA